jgi:hypothetical protein
MTHLHTSAQLNPLATGAVVVGREHGARGLNKDCFGSPSIGHYQSNPKQITTGQDEESSQMKHKRLL